MKIALHTERNHLKPLGKVAKKQRVYILSMSVTLAILIE